MREIKFRIWDKEFAWWLLGDLSALEWLTLNEYIKHEQKENCVFMQFTGLHDKNGKEIYEGDIVKADCLSDIFFVCQWNDAYASFEFNGNYQTKLVDYIECGLGGASYSTVEVIGNIYENPELIGKEGSE